MKGDVWPMITQRSQGLLADGCTPQMYVGERGACAQATQVGDAGAIDEEALKLIERAKHVHVLERCAVEHESTETARAQSGHVRNQGAAEVETLEACAHRQLVDVREVRATVE